MEDVGEGYASGDDCLEGRTATLSAMLPSVESAANDGSEPLAAFTADRSNGRFVPEADSQIGARATTSYHIAMSVEEPFRASKADILSYKLVTLMRAMHLANNSRHQFKRWLEKEV